MVRASGYLLALMLLGCERPGQATPLTASLLEDQARLERVSNRLSPQDREMFGRYLARRRMTAAIGSTPIVGADGHDPHTVGDAIRLTRRMAGIEAERDAALEAATAKREAAGDDIPRYNAAVNEYNAALEEYAAKVKALPPK